MTVGWDDELRGWGGFAALTADVTADGEDLTARYDPPTPVGLLTS